MAENIPVASANADTNWKKILTCGCLAMFVFMVLAGLSVFGVVYREKIPYVQNYFPTKTATPPHILVHPPAKDVKVTNDDFSNNLGEWAAYYRFTKVEVKDGKLFLESFDDGAFAIGYCDFCSFIVKSSHSLHSPYYLQADFNTEQKTSVSYGLAFNIIRETNSYYMFSINPALKTYRVNKVQDNQLVDLTLGSSNSIKSYPETNTLSVDFDAGIINLYINGQAVKSVTDKNPTDFGKVGVYVGDAGCKLIVDNLFAYHK